MKTDSLFYELFKLHPKSLFELAGLELDGEYVFESITVKSTEKRMDGFFRRKDGDGANGFLEVQGYDDDTIYWRQFREISTHYEQTKSKKPFVAIILFIDEKYDPKNCPVHFVPPNRLIRLYLPELHQGFGR
jgi:predicted transposase YdaD